MIVKPKVRGFICTNAHPTGCAMQVAEQIQYTQQQTFSGSKPKNVLIIGASTGYGLASRITAAFGYGAKTLGVFFEKPGTERRTGTAGWYNTAAFQQQAEAAGLWSKNINGDAFSDEIKAQVITAAKEMGPIDLIVYSLASPRRKDPDTEEIYQSVLKPINQAYQVKSLNTSTHQIETQQIEPANEEEIADTIKVMGGEDWERWLAQLQAADLLAEHCQTVAYTYIGKELTWPIYGKATIGRAKQDLDRAAHSISTLYADKKVQAYVCSLKAVVTQASSAIPIMPLYISLLFKVMKAAKIHEGCIEQIHGLFARRLYIEGEKTTDSEGRLRMDELELQQPIQDEVAILWDKITADNLYELSDYAGYQQEFLRLFGFNIDGVDYEKEISSIVDISNLLTA